MNINGAELTSNLDKLNKLWHKREFIGKLSNIIQYIRCRELNLSEFDSMMTMVTSIELQLRRLKMMNSLR